MAQRRGRQLVAGLAFTMLLALSPGAQAQEWGEDRWESLWTQVVTWLEALRVEGPATTKCDHGALIDPDGCPGRNTAGATDHGPLIDPNG
jgi:hypothetical protein